LQVTLSLIRQDGTTETERTTALEYLGPRHRLVIDASEDSYAGAGQPTANFGHLATLLVDGGGAAMGDNSHNIGYLRFPLQVPGKVVSVKLLIHTAPSEASESGDSGKIHLVDEPWEEYTLTYANRPKPGTVVGTLGRVGRDTLEERELKVDLTGRKELSLVLEPTSTDGANYYAREGGKGPQLVVEYVAE
ncbi:MAG: DNRLRE domain-containing protein, partial [Armatimonadetes bacterium]|nr:DNRLRE domain-containing protein [Armatimonadota bacterium]